MIATRPIPGSQGPMMNPMNPGRSGCRNLGSLHVKVRMELDNSDPGVWAQNQLGSLPVYAQLKHAVRL